ncbi:hypothetical protein GCM10010244_51030 [Streptomyces coeruleorubidus]|nr:hypothetical protein GCM10010244_51030 [Streptomyces bellus]
MLVRAAATIRSTRATGDSVLGELLGRHIDDALVRRGSARSQGPGAMRNTTGWQADAASRTLRRTPLERRDLRPDDLAIRVDYCGVCHSDLHAVNARDGEGGRPLVPGHEFTGVVTETGPAVTRFTVGDPVAVGNIVDSCGECAMCRTGQENFW